MTDGQDALRVLVLRYQAERHSLTLATHGLEGPWAAGLYFASDGLTLYFLSDPAARHCQDIVRQFRDGDALKIMGRAVRARFYRIVPSRLHFLDNSKAFSHREELTLP
jgi:hypothetical protein